jgi:hypothetical protein
MLPTDTYSSHGLHTSNMSSKRDSFPVFATWHFDAVSELDINQRPRSPRFGSRRACGSQCHSCVPSMPRLPQGVPDYPRHEPQLVCMRFPTAGQVAHTTRSIHNTPFTSFRVLFSHAVQAPSADDLCLLETFASSLSTFCRASEMKAQPIHVYQLLCQAARFTLKGSSPTQATQKLLVNPDVSSPMSDLLRGSTKAPDSGTLESLLDEESLIENHAAVDLGNWWTLEDDTESGTMQVT